MERTLARHRSVVDPTWFNPRTLDVFGLGAGGLTIALFCAKLGITNIRGFDKDIVEQENLGPSLYGWGHIDDEKPIRKVDACADIIRRDAKLDIITRHGDVRDVADFGDVVFLCLDSNDLKLEIITRLAALGKNGPERVFEGRMSERVFLVHSFDPRNTEHVDAWTRYYLPDSALTDAVPACGAVQVSMSSVAGIASHLLLQLFIDYVQWIAAGKKGRLVNQIYFDLNTYTSEPSYWD